MLTLRSFEKEIRSIVEEENSRDVNYSWSIHSFGKNCVTINWSYINIKAGEYFSLEIENIDTTEDGIVHFIKAYDNSTYGKEIINADIAKDVLEDESSLIYSKFDEKVLRTLLGSIFYRAHNCY